jgi:hypothetical protein
MGRRRLRRLALLAAASAGAYVMRRYVDERRDERRLAAPITAWPDVPADPPV